jgi:transcriptional accessory protein Tex/SPT6
MEKEISEFRLVGGKKLEEILKTYQDYDVFWMSGLWRKIYIHVDRFSDDFNKTKSQWYEYGSVFDIDINHDSKGIYVNGLSSNDLC